MSEQQFFFVFSNGSYSDYQVGSLYVSDHDITEAEWDAHYAAYQEEAARRYAPFQSMQRYQMRCAPGWAEYETWKNENVPEQTFIAKHGLRPVPYGEFWRD